MDQKKRERILANAKKRIEKIYQTMKTKEKLDIDDLIENLTIYEAELEIQNEELRDANERIVKLSDQYSDLYNNAPVGYLIFDKKGIIKKINDTALGILKGLNHSEDTGYRIREGYKPFVVYVDYDDHGKFINHLTSAVFSKKKESCELKLWRNDGQENYVILQSVAYFDEEFEEEMIKAVMIDNTKERIQANLLKKQNRELTELKEELESTNEALNAGNEKLSEERKQFLSILDNIPELIYCSDFETNEILFANQKTKDTVGRDITGEKCYEVLQKKDEICEFCTNKLIKDNENPYFWEYFNPILQKHYYVMDRKIKWHDQKDVRFELAVDITQQKHSEKALKTIVDRSPMVIVIFQGDGKTIDYLNPVFTQLLGYTKEDIPTNEEWYRLVYPDEAYREEVKENWAKMVQRELVSKKGTQTYLTTVTCKDGSQKHIDWGFISTGTQYWAYGIDLTRQKEAERQLRQEEEKYRLIAENLTDVIWILNLTKQKFTYISPSVYTLRGYTPEEAMAQDIHQSLTPESAKKVTDDISEVVPQFLNNPEEEMKKIHRHELRQPCKDGSIIWIETTTRYQLNEDNEVEVIGISRSIDERKKHEKRMETRLRYEKNIASFSNTLFLNKLNVINDSLKYILEAAQCSRVYIFENFMDEQNELSMRQTYEVCAQNVEPQIDDPDLQHIVYQKDGFVRWQEKLSKNEIINGIVNKFPQSEREILHSQGIQSILIIPIFVHQTWFGFIGFDEIFEEREWSSEDINLLHAAAEVLGLFLENRQNQEIILTRNKELKEAIATKDRFISVLAHDLRSPFNGLLGSCEVLRTGIEDFQQEEIVEFVGYIDVSAKRIFNLLTNLLEWSRIQQDVTPFNPKATDLTDLINETYNLLHPSAEAKGVHLELNVHEEIEAEVDSDMIKAVIRNLVSNAVKFTESGESVRIVAKKTSNQVEIEIADNGTGMDEKTKTSLFKIGETKSLNGTNGEEGTGFGLLLCKEFVDKHKGTIEVESELGKGTQIRVRLPLESVCE